LRRGLRGDGGLQRRFGTVHRNFRRVEIRLRQELLGAQLLGARVLLLRVNQRDAVALHLGLRSADVGLRLQQVGLRLIDLRRQERRVQPGDHLTLLHDRVEVGAEPADVARYLAAHLNGRHRLERSSRSDGVDDFPPRDRRGIDLNLTAVAAHVVGAGSGAHGGDDDQTDDRAFHDAPFRVELARALE
jgi:hypothetical protein